MHPLILWLLVVGLVWGAGAPAGRAHPLQMAGVKVVLGGGRVAVSARLHAHDLAKATGQDLPSQIVLEKELRRRLQLRVDGRPFVPATSRLLLDRANGLVLWQATSAEEARRATLAAPLFPEMAQAFTVLSVYRDQKLVEEQVLRAGGPKRTVAASAAQEEPASSARVVARFLEEGVRHIFLGPDHVLFLVSLLLLGGGFWQLFRVTAAFTLAHSVTLGLAATGWVSLPSRLVEPVIALSIVAVAGANLMGLARDTEARVGPGEWRPWLAFGFGLIHGFGFAGALAELGLPQENLLLALLAFNGGVEAGQLLIVLLLAPALAAVVQRRPQWQPAIVAVGSFCVAAIGSLWFAERVFAA